MSLHTSRKMRSWKVKKIRVEKMKERIISAFSKLRNFLSSQLLFVVIFTSVASSMAFAENRGVKEFWINKYGTAEKDKLTERAYNVFNRVLAASDRRAGVEPALYIINFSGTPWAQALADGSIILSRKALQFCYSNKNLMDGDSRMAFVIGHELAHQFNGDFWHYKFLRTAEDSNENIRAFQDIKELAKDPDILLTKELRADQYGIIYAALAGYDSDKIISGDKNFFLEWAEKEGPSGRLTDDLLSLSEKRARVVSMRLAEVSSRIVLFDMGVISYHLGRFDDSLVLFKKFASYFPGREVYSNIGAIYLQLAYSKFRAARNPESFPFALSFGIEHKTRAENINISSKGFTESVYREYNDLLRIAVENLKKAISYDPFYEAAKNNLGCAYIIESKYYDAVSTLEDALKLTPDSSIIQNNLGVAYIMLGQTVDSKGLIDKAEKILTAAKNQNHQARANWASFQRMYRNNENIPVVSNAFTDSFDDIEIDFKSSPGLKPGTEISHADNLQVLDETLNTEDNVLKVLKKQKENTFILTMGKRIRLVLYKEPSNLITEIKGGDKRRIYISDRWKNGIVHSENKSPDYFEF